MDSKSSGVLERAEADHPKRDRAGVIHSPSGGDLCVRGGARQGVSIAPAAYLDRGTGIEFEMEAAWVRRKLPLAARTIVDVGCGNGRLLESLPCANRVGLDHSIAGLMHARNRNRGLNVACALGGELPLLDQSVDAVIAQHVIEHMPNPDATIREWRRVLRPRGVLLLLTPNAAFADPSIFDDPTHVRLFSAHDVRDVLVRAGLLVSELRTLGLPWFREYPAYPGAWRLRRFVIDHAEGLSSAPSCRWKGQTLCCAAVRRDAP